MSMIYVVSSRMDAGDQIAECLSDSHFAVSQFRDVASLLAREKIDKPGCVMLDLAKMAPTALPEVRELLEPLPIIALSPRADVAQAVAAMKHGAADFLAEPLDRDKLGAAVRQALADSAERLAGDRRKQELLARFRTLSAREKAVLGAVLKGRANKQVAEDFGISPRTVETHRFNAMSKLGVRRLPDLMRIWLDLDGG